MANSLNEKKICLVIPSLQAGGMERVMSELANYFVEKKRAVVHLVLYGKEPEIFYPLSPDIIIHRPAAVFKNKFRTWHAFKRMHYLRNEIKKIQPDTILSFGEYWNSFVLLALLRTKYPVYISDRSQPDKSLGRFHELLRKWLYPKSAGVILQSEKAKLIYRKKIDNINIRVIGNPIREIKPRPGIQRENHVLMVGRLIKSKHQDRLIRIFAAINKRNWKLILVGYDHLKQANMDPLKKLTVELGISDRVVFAGKQSEVEKYYLSSKIFAFTSSSEGFPNAIGEAMSAGLPVIAYDCVAGPSEMIKDGENGFLIPLFDDIQFKTKLELLMDRPELREKFGRAAKESIHKFNLQDIGEQFYQFITVNN